MNASCPTCRKRIVDDPASSSIELALTPSGGSSSSGTSAVSSGSGGGGVGGGGGGTTASSNALNSDGRATGSLVLHI